MPTGRQSLPDNVYAISGGNQKCFRRKFRRSAFLRIHNELAEVVRDVPDSGDSEAQARVGSGAGRLFLSKSGHRLDRRGPPRGNERCNGSDKQQ